MSEEGLFMTAEGENEREKERLTESIQFFVPTAFRTFSPSERRQARRRRGIR